MKDGFENGDVPNNLPEDSLQNFEQELEKSLRQDSSINGHRVEAEIFFARHSTAEDIKQLQDKFEKADIYIPEAPGWNEELRQFLGSITRGNVDPSLFERLEKANPAQAEEARIIYKSNKPFTFIDYPSRHPLEKKSEDLKFRLTLLLIEAEHAPFTVIKDSFKVWNRESAEFSKEREEYMLSQFHDRIGELIEQNSSLRNKSDLKVLLFLGAIHTPVWHGMRHEGYDVEAQFQNMPFTYNFINELDRTYRFGGEPSDDLAARATMEVLFSTELQALIRGRINAPITSGDFTKFVRKTLSRLNEVEIEEIFDRVQQGADFDVLFTTKLQEKNVELPHSRAEYDSFIR